MTPAVLLLNLSKAALLPTALTSQRRVRALLVPNACCNVPVQVIPEVVDNVLDTVKFSVTYGDKAVTDGQHLSPSQAAVCKCLEQCCSATVVAGNSSWCLKLQAWSMKCVSKAVAGSMLKLVSKRKGGSNQTSSCIGELCFVWFLKACAERSSCTDEQSFLWFVPLHRAQANSSCSDYGKRYWSSSNRRSLRLP